MVQVQDMEADAAIAHEATQRGWSVLSNNGDFVVFDTPGKSPVISLLHPPRLAWRGSTRCTSTHGSMAVCKNRRCVFTSRVSRSTRRNSELVLESCVLKRNTPLCLLSNPGFFKPLPLFTEPSPASSSESLPHLPLLLCMPAHCPSCSAYPHLAPPAPCPALGSSSDGLPCLIFISCKLQANPLSVPLPPLISGPPPQTPYRCPPHTLSEPPHE